MAASTEQLMKAHMIGKMSELIQRQRNQSFNVQKGVPGRCSFKKMFWNMQQIYRRTPMSKCDFHVDGKGYF